VSGRIYIVRHKPKLITATTATLVLRTFSQVSLQIKGKRQKIKLSLSMQ
jgi:hypothetical protein